jgi:hypothetical protein
MQIYKLQKHKDIHINNLLILKSAFSIIDDMFVKEMENAEKFKKHNLRRWFCCSYFFEEKIIDPRKLSTFIEDVMDPYGRQDKIVEEIKKAETLSNNNRKQEMNIIYQENNYKKVWDEVKKTKNLLINNTSLIEQLYDKLEKGELRQTEQKKNTIFTSKTFPNVIKLFGDVNNKQLLNNIKLNIDEDNKLNSDNDEKKSKKSDSSNSLMDFDVVCEQK